MIRATPCGKKQRFVLRVKGSVGQVEMDFLLDPLAELADGDGFRFPVFQERITPGLLTTRPETSFSPGNISCFRVELDSI